MNNNRLLKVFAVVVMLMAVAISGVAAAPAPTGPERNAAPSNCPATLRQELGTVLPSGWSGDRESDCSLLGAQTAALTTLDNPNGHWIGPETVSAALGQQSYIVPTTGGSGDLTSGAATWRDAGASGRGPYASPQAAPVSTGRQNSYGPPGR
jgi:hypothetical protein